MKTPSVMPAKRRSVSETVAVKVMDSGIPHWWCKSCQAWHPIACPNGDSE